MDIWERLGRVFCMVFDDDDIQVRPETTTNDVEGWDSLSHVNLILAVESEFKVKFALKDLMKLKNVGDLAQAIQLKQLQG